MSYHCQKCLSSIFHCSIERAFKAPILGDATKFLNGFRFQPPVTEFTGDSTWGNPNGVRYPVTKGNLLMAPGILMTDKILERVENKYWKWTIYDFRPISLFFLNRAIGEWRVSEIDQNKVQVQYTYTFYPRNWLTCLLTWIFVQFQWKGMMQKALTGIQEQAESNETFIYETSA